MSNTSELASDSFKSVATSGSKLDASSSMASAWPEARVKRTRSVVAMVQLMKNAMPRARSLLSESEARSSAADDTIDCHVSTGSTASAFNYTASPYCVTVSTM